MFFFKLFYPMLIGSTLYALNGFVDNFMVGHIQQGGAALSAVNAWTNIMMGIFIGTGAAGSIINARYYFSGQYDKAQELFRFRLLFTITISSLMAMTAWIVPETMIKVFLKKGDGTDLASYNLALDNAKQYIKVIAAAWIMIAVTSQFGNSLREIGHGKASMYWGYATITTNITLNSILMYGVGMGVAGAAWASLAARLVAGTIGIIYMIKIDTKISFNPFTIFKIKLSTIKDFWSKWYMFVSYSIVTLFITLRVFFYDAGYTTDSGTLGQGVSAMSVLAISGAIMNIFTTTFSAAGSMAANTVGKDLARGKEDSAFKTAKELKGFITLMAIILSVLMFMVAWCLPYMHFLSENKYENGKLTLDGSRNLLQARNALFVICLNYPFWIWFTVSFRCGSTGKKGFWFAFVDTMVSGPIQLGWGAALAYGIVPNVDLLQHNFWMTYSLFFISDFFKLGFQEYLFYNYKWNISITNKTFIENKAELSDEIARQQANTK